MFKIGYTPPKPQEYCQLRKLCGLSERSLLAAQIALPKSLFTITVRGKDELLIAMGRVIGDLGCFVQICDIAVHPDFQGRGFSKTVMDEIMSFINANVPQCAFVNLFADVDFLYQKYGFIHAEHSKGMYLNRN